jgi:signal transduction histidine kinase
MALRSLRNEILFATIGLTVLTVVATTLIGVYATTTAGEHAEESTSLILREQAKEYMVQIATAAAKQEDIVFEHIRNETEGIARYAENLETTPQYFNQTYWKLSERVKQIDLAYINNEDDISSVHIPSFVRLTPSRTAQIERSAMLDFLIPGVMKHTKDLAAVYTIDTAGVTRYYPNIVLGKLAPHDYDPRPDTYYAPVTPENNPNKQAVWSKLYDDVAGRGPVITLSVPMHVKDEFSGIAAMDVLLANIILRITEYAPVENSYAFLLDKSGNTVAFPEKAYLDVLGRPQLEGEGRINLISSQEAAHVSHVITEMTAGRTGFSSFMSGETRKYIAFAPLEQTGFSYAVVADEAVILKAVGTLHQEISGSIRDMNVALIIPASVFIILLASLLAVFLISQIVRKVQELTHGVKQIGSGNLDFRIAISSNNEIGELASAFNHMSEDLKVSHEKLQEYNRTLETKIAERTKELAHANDLLEEKNRILQVIDQRKSEFVSIVSHQLRTPITAIKGYSSLLMEGAYGVVPDAAKEPIERIFRSSSRLANMVTDFLDISKIEQGTMTYTKEEVDVGTMVADLGGDFAQVAHQKGLEFSVEIPKDERFVVMADDGKLRQIFSNLIDNSIKYTPHGRVTVSLSRDTERNMVVMRLLDTGIGLSADDIHHLFGKFARGSGGQRQNTEGSGLGLYVAKRMLEAQGGKMWVDSLGVGQGSTFFVELPLA